MLDKLAKHFHETYYPDLPYEEIRAHLDTPEVLDRGMGYIAENGHDDPEILGAAQDHQKPEQKTLNSIYTKWPALKKLGNVTLKADTGFTREKTGVGDIEYFSPNKAEYENGEITYPNGYKIKHPNTGTHGIVYNPATNNEQNIALDMLHGMGDVDSGYISKRDALQNAFLKSRFKEDLATDWRDHNEKTKGRNDGYDRFKNNWVDGQIRGLLFEGTDEDFKKQNYWKDAQKTYLADPKIKESFEGLKKYLTTK